MRDLPPDFLERIRRPHVMHHYDTPEPDYEPEPPSQRQMDERADEMADAYEKEMDDRW